jgi:hypothetical protein
MVCRAMINFDGGGGAAGRPAAAAAEADEDQMSNSHKKRRLRFETSPPEWEIGVSTF